MRTEQSKTFQNRPFIFPQIAPLQSQSKKVIPLKQTLLKFSALWESCCFFFFLRVIYVLMGTLCEDTPSEASYRQSRCITASSRALCSAQPPSTSQISNNLYLCCIHMREELLRQVVFDHLRAPCFRKTRLFSSGLKKPKLHRYIWPGSSE